MTPETADLARRAVACKRWRWRPGMLATGPGWLDMARICDVDADGTPVLWEYRGWARGPGTASSRADDSPWEHPEAVPVLGDEATLGCLLALVREAWGDPEMHLVLGGAGWAWLSGESRVATVVLPIPAGRTEAEALLAALEAAP